MADHYRLTIRTDEKTADAFRDLAYQEAMTLGEMLAVLVGIRLQQPINVDISPKELARQFSK